MFIVGVTGSLGSGKSTVAAMFKSLGAGVVDADEINRRLLKETTTPLFKKILRLFGNQILAKGAIDRKKLGRIVFQSPAKLKKLCAITHPAIIREMKKRIAFHKKAEKKKKTILIIDVPLLIEAGLLSLVDTLVVVKASRDKQIKRIQRRMNINKSEALRRMTLQMPLEKKIALANEVIDNNKTFNKTKRQVRRIWQKLLQTEKKTKS